MSEQQIRDGYERLGVALAPPPDVAERIARRVVVRRRRRRAALVGATAVAVAGVGGGYAVLSGGDRVAGTTVVDQPSGPSAPTSTLVMTRPDGSTYAFPEVTVSCEPPETVGGDPLGTGPGRIWMYSPIDLTGSEEADDIVVHSPFVYFEGVVAKLQDGRELSLPVDGPGDSSTYPAVLFVADPTGGGPPNEASSGEGGSGTLRVVRASCAPVPVLELEVDGTLASEVGQEPLDINGAVSSR